MKSLNPIRRARRMEPKDNGKNNPNVDGQNNGFNAWMDAQLSTSLDHEDRVLARYTKKNSDMSRCLSIDDVPIKGLSQKSHPLVYNPELAAQAKALINNDNISVCRETGVCFTAAPRASNTRPTSSGATTTDRNPSPPPHRGINTSEQQRRINRLRTVNSQDRRYESDEIDSQYFNDDTDNYNDFLGPEQYLEQEEDYDDWEKEIEHYDNNDTVYWNEPKNTVKYRHPDPYLDQPFQFRSHRARSSPSRECRWDNDGTCGH